MPRKDRAILQEIRQRSFKTIPQTVQFLYSQAEKHHKVGNYNEAIVYTRVITALDPTFSPANDLKVICYKILKEYDKGMREFSHLQKIDTKHFDS